VSRFKDTWGLFWQHQLPPYPRTWFALHCYLIQTHSTVTEMVSLWSLSLCVYRIKKIIHYRLLLYITAPPWLRYTVYFIVDLKCLNALSTLCIVHYVQWSVLCCKKINICLCQFIDCHVIIYCRSTLFCWLLPIP
jgi:hypothetical protein